MLTCGNKKQKTSKQTNKQKTKNKQTCIVVSKWRPFENLRFAYTKVTQTCGLIHNKISLK